MTMVKNNFFSTHIIHNQQKGEIDEYIKIHAI